MDSILNLILQQNLNELLILRNEKFKAIIPNSIKQIEVFIPTIGIFEFEDDCWYFAQKTPVVEECVYCGGLARGNYSIHRDGFGIGPEVDLCDDCGQDSTPTCADIWERVAKCNYE